jgi:hypothetical protein
MEHTEAPPAARLLPRRDEWPYGRRAAAQRDEIASFQLIKLQSIPLARAGL